MSSDDPYLNEENTLRKRFSPEEDSLIKKLVNEEGITNWEEVGRRVPGRTPRQCRDRYKNYLFKEVVKKPWTKEEDQIILEKYQIYGSHWVKIAQHLSGRSGNNVKNRWHKYLALRNPKNEEKVKNMDISKKASKGKQGKEDKDDVKQAQEIKITFPEVLTCRPWELITPKDCPDLKKK